MKKNKIKKIGLYISITIVLFIIAWGSTTFYKSLKQAYLHPYHAIPENSIVLIRASNIHNLWNEILTENDLFADLITFEKIVDGFNTVSKTDSIIKVNEDILELISSNEFYISIHKTDDQSLQALYILPYSKLQEKRISKFMEVFQTDFEEKHNETFIHRLVGNNAAYYYTKQGILAISYSPELLKNSLDMMKSGRRIDDNPDFLKVDKTSGKKVDISLYIQYQRAFEELKKYIDEEHLSVVEKLQILSEWMETDVHVRKKIILWNGYSSLIEKKSYLNVFKNQNLGNHNFLSILPKELFFFASLSFSESAIFLKQSQEIIDQHENKKNMTEKVGFWNQLSISQIAKATYIDKNNSKSTSVILAKPIDKNHSKDIISQQLESASDSSSYLGFTIGNINLSNSATCFSPEIFSNSDIQTFAIIDSFIVFANQMSDIKYIIDAIINVQVFTETMLYSEMSEYSSNESNLFIFCAISHAKDHILAMLKNDYRNQDILTNVLKNSAYAGIQLGSAKDDLIMTSAFVKYESTGTTQITKKVQNEPLKSDSIYFNKKTAKKIWELEIPNEIINAQLLTDPSEDYFKVVAFDNKANMMMFDNKGTKLWQIKIKSQADGKISMVDFYKNGKWQMYFNTSTHIYLIDKLGRPVGKTYPYSFRVNAANHGTIIDINNKKEYRAFFINSNRQISCIDLNTNIVSTWKTPVLNRPSTLPIQANKANGKWILTAIDNEENIHFYNLDGIPAFPIQKNITKHHGSQLSFVDFPQPTWYYMSNSGFLIKIFADGKVAEQKIPINDIPITYTTIKCARSENIKHIVTSKNYIHIISSELNQTNSIPYIPSAEKQQINTLLPSHFSLQQADKTTLFNMNNNSMSDFYGKINMLKTNNVKFLINFNKRKLSLWEIE